MKYYSGIKIICSNYIYTIFIFAFVLFIFADRSYAQQSSWPSKTYYRYVDVDGIRIFYREAGNPSNPAILLLHGFPSSSHTYRELIPLLSGRFYVVAPDYLGSGYSDHPDPDKQKYTFDLLAKYTSGFVNNIELKEYVLYMQDFGAPVGFRIMMKNPERIKGIVVQNANAYLEGLTEKRQSFFKNANTDRSSSNVAALYEFTGKEAIINKQYLRDVRGKETIMSPDSWTHDLAFLKTEKEKKIQVQLFQDYYNNLLAYPKWQAFLRKHKPPALIVWGKNDPAFIAAGAKAYLNDLPDADLHLIDAGHFAVEEKPVEIAQYITEFANRVYRTNSD